MQGIEEAAANLQASMGELRRCLASGPDDGAAPSTTEAAAAQAAADSAEPAVELQGSAPPRHRRTSCVGTIAALIVLAGIGYLLTTAVARGRSSRRK
jgi:hypothetical protein